MEKELFINLKKHKTPETDINNSDQVVTRRFKEYQPWQSRLIMFSSKQFFPVGTFEHFVVDTINTIDISLFQEKEDVDKGGPDEYHPRSLLGIIFYGYADGIFSSRKLALLCKNDFRYIFVSGYEIPDHSTISRFTNKYKDAIQQVFT